MLTQLPEKMVENAGQQPEKTVRKREAWDKVGKYKYIIAKINAVQAEQELQRKMLRFLSEGLESFLNFEPKDIQELVVKDVEFIKTLRTLRYNLYTNAGNSFLSEKDMKKLNFLIEYATEAKAHIYA